MKNKISTRIMSAILIMVMIPSLGGCGSDNNVETVNKANQVNKDKIAVMEPMELEEVYSYSFDFIGGADVMPIGGYYGPIPSTSSTNGIAMPNYITDEIFEAIAGCGVNVIVRSEVDYNLTPENVIKSLELGEKYGVGVTVWDRGLTYKEENGDTLSTMDARLQKYCNYPSFVGIYAVDEPNTAYYSMGGSSGMISSYAPRINALAELDVWTFGNLLPCARSKKEQYTQYVEEWLSTCNMKMLMWDRYVHDEGVSVANYFYNMSFCREKAEEYKIPFWPFVQAGTHWESSGKDVTEYYPDEGQVLWNVNTCLAYGAKGIAWFPLLQPRSFSRAASKAYDFERNGLIGAAGNKNRWWYYAQVANRQIAAIDEVLMNSVSKGVIVTSEKAKEDNVESSCIMKGTSWRELTNVTGDAMVGCFNYKGKSAFYVVNYDMEYAQHINLEFGDNYRFTVIQDAETSKCQGNMLKLTMKPGEGALVVME